MHVIRLLALIILWKTALLNKIPSRVRRYFWLLDLYLSGLILKIPKFKVFLKGGWGKLFLQKKFPPRFSLHTFAILEKRKIFRAGAMSFVRVQGSPEGAYQEVCNVGADAVNRAKIVVPVRKIFRFSSIMQ